MNTEVLIHRFNVDEYHKLGEAGILHEDDRVELIDGEILDMTPIGSKHASYVSRLTNLFISKLQDRGIVNPQNPIRLNNKSEPQPDITILKYRDDFYSDKIPEPEDVLLLIEIADTTLDFDRNTKIPLYARANIQEVWLIDISDNCIEIYQNPSPDGYEIMRRARHNQIISPQNLPDISITAAQIFKK